MWRRAAAKLLSLRSVARPNQMGTSSLWSAIFRPSGSVTKKDEDVIPTATGHERVEPKFEMVGGDLVDYDFLNGPFGTKASTRMIYDTKRATYKCLVANDVAPHKSEEFWLIDGKVHLKCIGIGGIAYYNPQLYP
ncbi:hypothetical protein LXL04_018018 [Taraxacum kok-saghyz]